MLKYLKVSQFAIIENLEVYFDNGMNVLTGETGAGKSLLIDAIGLLLGDRASSDIIRSGCAYAEISALFAPVNANLRRTLEELDIPVFDEEVLIKRRIKVGSGNVIKVNGEVVTLQDLKVLSLKLADIHTQHDTKRLFDPEQYLSLLDGYDKTIEPIKETYQKKRSTWLGALETYIELKKEKNEVQKKLELLKYEIEELDKHDLKPDELDTIEARLRVLQNFDALFKNIKQAHEALESSGSLENIYEAKEALARVIDYDEALPDVQARIESAYLELDDIKATLYDKLDGLDFDPEELDALETRKHTLDTLRRKYGLDLSELIDYHAQIKDKVSQYTDYDNTLEQAYQEAREAFEIAYKTGQELSRKRRQVAKTIERDLKHELESLELPNVSFTITFLNQETPVFDVRKSLKTTGIDTVDFLISPNPGESEKPLKKIASGGELSRIMLGLKTLFAQKESLNLMIFDEIDSGVSGYVASQVAKKMKHIAKNIQVIAITHLPQVAAKADHHYHIAKEQNAGRTKTFVTPLSREDRIKTIAAMISSDAVSEQALKSAAELLK